MIVVGGFVLAAAVLCTIVVLLVRRQLQEKYAALWMLIGSVLLLVSAVPGLVVGLTRLLGVEVPANLIFAMAIVLLIGVALHLSWELSRAEEEIRRLAEETALLRRDVDRLLDRGCPEPDAASDEGGRDAAAAT